MKTFKELIDSLVEITVGQREKKTTGELQKDRAERRKGKAKKKAYMKKYRTKHNKPGDIAKRKRMAAQGKTETGKQKTVRGGAGAAERAKELKQKLTKR